MVLTAIRFVLALLLALLLRFLVGLLEQNPLLQLLPVEIEVFVLQRVQDHVGVVRILDLGRAVQTGVGFDGFQRFVRENAPARPHDHELVASVCDVRGNRTFRESVAIGIWLTQLDLHIDDVFQRVNVGEPVMQLLLRYQFLKQVHLVDQEAHSAGQNGVRNGVSICTVQPNTHLHFQNKIKKASTMNSGSFAP